MEDADHFEQFLDVTLGESPVGDEWRRNMDFVSGGLEDHSESP